MLDFSAVGQVSGQWIFPKRVIEMGWNKMKVGRGRVF